MNLKTVSTDRIDEIKHLINDALAETRKADTAEFEAYMMANMEKEVLALNALLTPLYQEAAELQKQGKVGKIQYIRIFPRRTAVLEKQYGLSIRLYDATDYKCRIEISREWNPEFFGRLFEKQLEKVIKRAEMKIFRITPREEQLIRFLFLDFFHFYVLTYLAVLEDVFIYVEPMLELETEETVEVTFGNYLEKGALIKAFSKSSRGKEL